MMRVLVACEFSGTVRDAFRARGHDAVSADLLPAETPGPHYKGDARDLLTDGWDLLIAHPPCTRLCNSGVRWLEERDLWAEMREAARLFRDFLNAPVPRVAVENPVMHRYAREIIGRGPDFTVQPWMFGDGEVKRTCFWTRNLLPLRPTHFVAGREARIHRVPPSEDRAKIRSVTYPGIAEAIADQWGCSVQAMAGRPLQVVCSDFGPLFETEAR
jgi:hypothetical protein